LNIVIAESVVAEQRQTFEVEQIADMGRKVAISNEHD